MSVGIGVDPTGPVDRAIRWFRRKRAQKVPVGRLLGKIEKDYRIKLSAAQKDDIVEYLREQRRILTSTSGKTYVTTTAVV